MYIVEYSYKDVTELMSMDEMEDRFGPHRTMEIICGIDRNVFVTETKNG